MHSLTLYQYCRLTRIIRDIPSTDIVAGNKLTNFRQVAEDSVQKAGLQSKDIRAREIRNKKYAREDLILKELQYKTTFSQEYFLQFVVETTNEIVAFLRLSLPKKKSFIDELQNSAIIREIHVYGQVVKLGEKGQRSQHKGLGTELIEHARKIAQKKKFEKLAVISAIGTREYYRKKGFSDGELYQFMSL